MDQPTGFGEQLRRLRHERDLSLRRNPPGVASAKPRRLRPRLMTEATMRHYRPWMFTRAARQRVLAEAAAHQEAEQRAAVERILREAARVLPAVRPDAPRTTR